MSHIKKGASVIITTGKDRGKTGKVLRVLPTKMSAIVEGVNLIKKHQKKRKQDEPAGILEIEAPINLAKISFYCSKCKKAVKVKVNRSKDDKKKIVCKKCQSVLS